MKSESIIIISGISMIVSGLILFYFIENNTNLDTLSRFVKHGGLFVGLLGIGVMIAGILLRLVGRDQMPIQGEFDI